MYAVFMLLFGDSKYVKGGIITANVHKQFIKKLDLSIHVNVMVDDIIYNNHKNELISAYDNVYLINLNSIKIQKNDETNDRHSSYMKYLINKYQILK